MRLAQFLDYAAQRFPERTAVTHGEQSVTFAQLQKATNGLAAFLKGLGLAEGDRVALLWENSVEYVQSFFAISRTGFVIVPLDTSAHPETLGSILKDCEAKVLICQARYQRHLPKVIDDQSPVKHVLADKELRVELPGIWTYEMSVAVAVEPKEVLSSAPDSLSWDDAPDELAAIFYTSGSTGASKGVMLSHRNLVSNTIGTVEYLELTENDSVLVILPFYYIYGNSLLLTHVACGGRLVIDNRFMYPEVILDTMEEEQVTGFSGVPSNFIILLNKSTFRERKLEQLRYFTQAGGAMAPEIIRELMKLFGHKQIFIMYGQTEAAPRASWLPPDQLEAKLGSIGIAVPGVNLMLLDDKGNEVPQGQTGEIVISGPNVMLGYWKQQSETDEVLRDGNLYTGDLARQDEDGFFYVVGRKKEIIKTGGNRVSAKEVEECLLAHQAIIEAAVVGVPDDLLGEAIHAFISVEPGSALDTRAVQEHCKQHLAVHKAPKKVIVLESLPKYQSGKVNKPLLTRQAEEALKS